jgi:hypothetical protein
MLRVWAEFLWLRMRSSGGLSWTRLWTNGFHKRWWFIDPDAGCFLSITSTLRKEVERTSETSVNFTEILSRHLPGGMEENHEKCRSAKCQCRDLNPAPPESEPRALPLCQSPRPNACITNSPLDVGNWSNSRSWPLYPLYQFWWATEWAPEPEAVEKRPSSSSSGNRTSTLP